MHQQDSNTNAHTKLSVEKAELRIAINGFGRIGRNVLRAILENTAKARLTNAATAVPNNIQVVAINDTADVVSLVHLLNYDSTHGRLANIGFHASLYKAEDNPNNVDNYKQQALLISTIDNTPILTIALYNQTDPTQLPWAQLGIDVVLESTGMFRSYEGAYSHIIAGAKRVIIGAAPFDNVDACIVMGVNHHLLDDSLKVISSVSCTTQALVPLINSLDKSFGVQSAMMTEIHAVTADQKVLDQGHRDLRRSRAAGYNIIPTTSSSIKATQRVLPQMQGRLNGHSIRVPTIDVAAIDVTFTFNTAVTIAQIKTCLENAANNELKGIMGFTEEPLVSSDFVHQTESLIIDSAQLMQVGEQFKVFAWYDNEWGYANRLVDMCNFLAMSDAS